MRIATALCLSAASAGTPAALADRVVRFEVRAGTEMNVDVSPDGHSILFDLLGDIYTLPVTGGAARRLTSGPAFDKQAVFSPDGRQIAYISDVGGSDNVWIMQADGSQARAFTHEIEASLTAPEWAPAGSEHLLMARRELEYRLYRPDGTGEPANFEQLDAIYAADGRSVHAVSGGAFSTPSILRIHLADRVVQPLNRLSWPQNIFRPALSPDGRWLAYGVRFENRTGLRLFDLTTEKDRWLIYPLPDRDTSTDRFAPQVQKLSMQGQTAFPRLDFTADSQAVIIANGGHLQRIDIKTGTPRPIEFTAQVEQRVASRPIAHPRLDQYATDANTTRETLALTGATLLTMRNEERIDNGIVIVRGNRIAAVGTADQVKIPDGARIMDLSGKTIIPGLIDLSAEIPFAQRDAERRRIALAANLSFGVTTLRSPVALATAPTEPDLAAGALDTVRGLQAGRLTGPRLLLARSVANARVEAFASLDAVRGFVAAQKQLGLVGIELPAFNFTRRQRQWLAQAAREQGLAVEGAAGDLPHALTLVLDGYSAIPGALPNAQLYADVKELMARTKIHYIPTLVDAPGGPNGALYFHELTDVRNDPRLRELGLNELPYGARWTVREDYHFIPLGHQVADLERRGGSIATASAGKLPGLGLHWEMWSLQLGGSSPRNALRAATIGSAEALGLAAELGTLEAGKRADLVVLEHDPLLDLGRSRAVYRVMRDGQLFDAATLATLWPRQQPPPAIRDRRFDPP